jgi:hypothetical protein
MARAYANRFVLLIALALTGCRPFESTQGRPPPVAFVDLLETLPSAERRARPPVDSAIRIDLVGPPGDLRPALVTSTPARVIWSTRLPSRARLETAVMLAGGHGARTGSANARIGISDDRRYEQLADIRLDGAEAPRAWQTVSIDLGAYSDWQWSLFYRPWERTWRIVLGADGEAGAAIAWARPFVQAGQAPDRRVTSPR